MVPELSARIVTEDCRPSLLITYDMCDATAHGNRLIMMRDGYIIVNVQGEDKRKLTVEALLKLFAQACGCAFTNERAILA